MSRARMRSALAVVALLLMAGCSSNSAPSDPTSPTTGRGEQLRQEGIAYFKLKADCLTESGFPAHYDNQDGAMIVAVGPGQDDDYDRADKVCEKTLPAPPPEIISWTDAEIEDLYNQSWGAYHCLIAHGYQPISEPPTLEKYMADYRSDQGPYSAHTGFGKGMLPDDVCPQPTLR